MGNLLSGQTSHSLSLTFPDAYRMAIYLQITCLYFSGNIRLIYMNIRQELPWTTGM